MKRVQLAINGGAKAVSQFGPRTSKICKKELIEV